MTKAMDGKRIWLTGASMGIGEALVYEFMKHGARVAISARNEVRLREISRELGEDKVLVVPLDVTNRDANLEAVKKIEEVWGGIDIAVFNAGTCEYVDVQTFDSSMFERVIATNFLSMAYGIEAALPSLRRGTQPQLIGMSSSVAWLGLPRAEAYGASKAAILHMLEALRVDLYREGIQVGVICPGFVKTPLTDKNDFPMPMRIDAGDAAKIIVRGIARRRNVIHFPKLFTYSLRLLALLPTWAWTRLGQSMVKPGSGA